MAWCCCASLNRGFSHSTKLNAVARSLDANKPGVLNWFRFAFNRNRSERMIGRIGRQARKSYSEAILFEFHLLAGGKKPRGFYFRHQTRQSNRVARPEINMHVERVLLARKTGKFGSVHLTTIRGVNGGAVTRHPLPHFRQDTHGILRNRAIRLGADVQEIVSAVAGTGNEIPNYSFGALPIVIGPVVAPAVVQRHATFPRPASLLRNDFLLGC